jgi:hypothetical protein
MRTEDDDFTLAPKRKRALKLNEGLMTGLGVLWHNGGSADVYRLNGSDDFAVNPLIVLLFRAKSP